MAVERINYQAGKTACTGALVYDERASGPRPLLLMAPNWLGVTDDAIKRAAAIAGSKYVAFVADMYGGGKIPAGPPEAAPLANGLRADAPERRRRIGAALDTLRRRKQQAKDRRSQTPGRRRLLLRRRQCPGARAHRRRPAGRHLPARRSADAAPGEIRRYQSRHLRACTARKIRWCRKRTATCSKRKWKRQAPNGRCWCSAACCIRSAKMESDVPGIACFDPGAARQCYAMIDDFATAAFDGKL